MSITVSPIFGSPFRPIGVLVAGATPEATSAMMAAFAAGRHPRLWLHAATGRHEVVSLLDSIHFDLVVCDGRTDPAAAELVDAVRWSPYGSSLLLADGGAAAESGERLDVAVHHRFALEVPAPPPARPHPIEMPRPASRRSA